MTTKLDQPGWAAAQQFAPCVLCHRPAISSYQLIPRS